MGGRDPMKLWTGQKSGRRGLLLLRVDRLAARSRRLQETHVSAERDLA